MQLPRRPCGQPGCPTLVDSGRCEKHRLQHQRSYDATRDQDVVKFYNSKAWRSLRDYVRRDELGVCRTCKAEGRAVVGDQVDHIVSIRRDPGRRLDRDNLQLLCTPCHRRKTRCEETEDRGPRVG